MRIFFLILGLLFFTSCLEAIFLPKGKRIKMITTGYCPCKKCCGWKRNWFGRPVYAHGKSKGKPKMVGICADGTRAKKGTLAADPNYYEFGTKFYIPGYGFGTVHDKGGEIVGPNRLDLFFSSHNQALAWGVREKTVILIEGD